MDHIDISVSVPDGYDGEKSVLFPERTDMIKSGETVLFTRPLRINGKALSVEKPSDPEETNAYSSETAANESSAEESSPLKIIFKVILITIIALITLVILYWIVVQFIKRRRMRLRRKQIKRKTEIQRIRRLREQQRKDADDFGI